MSFQFLCPQGHLLEGEEAHMGMECECPQCGTAFIIPTIQTSAGAAKPASSPPPPPIPPPPSQEFAPPDDSPFGSTAPIDVGEMLDLGKAVAAEAMLHIPCPNGHELETPPEMIGQRAQCPHCGVEFKLRRERSIEYQYELELLDRKRARFFFQLAIVAACFVVVVLLAMIVMIVV